MEWSPHLSNSGSERLSIDSAGIKESTLSTINERKFRIINAINEIIAIIEDSRLHRLGSPKCAKEIWKLELIPILLNSAEILAEIPADSFVELYARLRSINWLSQNIVP